MNWDSLLAKLQAITPTLEIINELRLANVSTRLPDPVELEESVLLEAYTWLESFEKELETFNSYYKNMSPERWQSLVALFPLHPSSKKLTELALQIRASWIVRPDTIKKRKHRKREQ